MTRHYIERLSAVKEALRSERTPATPSRRRRSRGDHWTPFHPYLPNNRSSRPSSFVRSVQNSISHHSSYRRALGGFLARRRSLADTSLSSPTAHSRRQSRDNPPLPTVPEESLPTSPRRSDWETEMHDYFDALKQNLGGQRHLASIVDDSMVKYDRRRRGHFHYGEEVANQFDVSLKHVRDLLHHMYDRYDTVTCFSMHLLQPGDIIYYIEPFVLGSDQEIEGETALVLGGSRFAAAVKVKGRFGIVTKLFSRALSVAPIYTFNGAGLASKNPLIHREYVDLFAEGHFDDETVSPHKPLEVGKAFCEMKPRAAVHLITTSLTLTSQVLIAGSIRSKSLDRLCDLITRT